MTKYEAKWSGTYPCLCSGEWALYIDGKLCDVTIPFQGEPADTFGEYQRWYFGDDWDEVWETYFDGLNGADWCDTYKDYLSQVAPKSDWDDVFIAFQSEDWRHSSCGGCI